MSDYASGPEDEDVETKDEWKKRMGEMIGVDAEKMPRQTYEKMVFWERIRAEWRSEEVSFFDSYQFIRMLTLISCRKCSVSSRPLGGRLYQPHSARSLSSTRSAPIVRHMCLRPRHLTTLASARNGWRSGEMSTRICCWIGGSIPTHRALERTFLRVRLRMEMGQWTEQRRSRLCILIILKLLLLLDLAVLLLVVLYLSCTLLSVFGLVALCTSSVL